jgi:molybdate transport system substrate-binding protein
MRNRILLPAGCRARAPFPLGVVGALVGILAAFAAPAARADELKVLATGVFEFALHDLARPFKEQSGKDVSITGVNAGVAAAKLDAGEAYDVVFSSHASLHALGDKGRVDPATIIDIGRMRLGVAVKSGAAKPDLKTPDALRAALLAAPGVAYIDPSGGGTAGAQFLKIFDRLGITKEVRAKEILCATGADVVRALTSGKATIGMTQASELIGAEGTEFVGMLPEEVQLVTVYAAGLPASARDRDAGAAFIRFVTAPAGVERLRKSGWQVGADLGATP